ncbi:TetR/AcrR family transcriptional regulator [Kineosporia babensis]|uniref:TetR family transcriptional regulator n=1 Tax=Kineosporia babensis TaxID=499548 RepID=A0A9X1NI46_9ACTN|nr:TetR family transcriptional regulator [Kineosporia babensis]MCD5314460.1 TetR family transcriptional regulator [Kineosporia babensis]
MTDSQRPRVPRRQQAKATRELLLTTAERLYAENGLAAVSSRQIIEAAGVGNNSALAYHVGTRDDLLRAIARSHGEVISGLTRRKLDAVRDEQNAREVVAAIVQPYTMHLTGLGHPSWFARFTAQLAADPVFSREVHQDPDVIDQVNVSLTKLLAAHGPISDEHATLRRQMLRLTVVHTCAEYERQSAGSGVPADWPDIGEALTDAVTGLLTAPADRAEAGSRRRNGGAAR